MKIKRELLSISMVLLPCFYLLYIWDTIPETIPIHWNFKGEIDRYGNKAELWLIILFLPVLTYVMLSLIPIIDPKKKLGEMGGKYDTIKFALTAASGGLAILIIYFTQHTEHTSLNVNAIALALGIMFIILGNYLQTIKANYFIGIRTPWTLESEKVWRATHRLGGKMWFGGGLIIVLSSLLLTSQWNIRLVQVLIAMMIIVPIVYSYIAFQQEEQRLS